jgi:hypothetical protein
VAEQAFKASAISRMRTDRVGKGSPTRPQLADFTGIPAAFTLQTAEPRALRYRSLQHKPVEYGFPADSSP